MLMNITLRDILTESDDITFKTALDTAASMFYEYDKILTITDYCEEGLANPEMFFQEGTIMDEATGKHTTDSTFWKIVKFLPRLVIAMFKALINAVTGSNGHDKDHEKATANLASASQAQLAEWAESTNAESKGNVQFDPKKKVFFLAKPFRHIRNYIYILTGLPAIFVSIRQMIKNDNNEYKAILKNLGSVLIGKKDLNAETTQLTMDGLSKLLKDANSASKAMIGISDEIGMNLSKKIEKDFANGGDPSDKIAAQQLLLKIKEAGDKIYIVTTFHRIGIKIRAKIAGWAIGKTRSVFSDESKIQNDLIDERENAKAKVKALKAERKALREQEMNEKYGASQIAKQQEKLDKANAKVAKQQEKLEKQRQKNQESSEAISRGEVPKKRFLGWGFRHQY